MKDIGDSLLNPNEDCAKNRWRSFWATDREMQLEQMVDALDNQESNWDAYLSMSFDDRLSLLIRKDVKVSNDTNEKEI